VTGIFPFSVIEFLLYGCAAAFIVALVIIIIRIVKRKYERRKLRQPKNVEMVSAESSGTELSAALDFKRLAIVLCCVGLTAAAVYMFNSEINYNRRPFSEEIGLVTGEYSKEDIAETIYYVADIARENIPYVNSGVPNGFMLSCDLEDTAQAALKNLALTYDCLNADIQQPKPVLTSRFWLSRGLIAGVYSPFTLEANYNSDMPDIDKPYVACHELSHLSGFMREDEAGFIAILACVESGNPDFAYSGAVNALGYLLNAYYSAATIEEYHDIYLSLPAEVINDIILSDDYWREFRQTITQKVYNTINDTGLKANGQEDGVRSYGQIADLLIEYNISLKSEK
jgi:hypothetical protein